MLITGKKGDYMAVCPHCGVKLHIWNIRAECPKCGVNIPNYDWEARLERDSEIAESSFAKFNAVLAKLKYSFVGSKLRIARIPVSVLPLFGFLLPLGKLAVSLPLNEAGYTLNAVTIVKFLMKIDVFGFIGAVKSPVIGDGVLMLLLSLILVLLSAASLIVSLVFLLLNYLNLRSKGLFITNLVASIMMAGSGICYSSFMKMVASSTMNKAIGGGISWGTFAAAILFLISAVTNLVVALKSETNTETEN